MTSRDLEAARAYQQTHGGYLLQVGMPGACHCYVPRGRRRECFAGCGESTYEVVDHGTALTLGRTEEQLAALAPSYDETA